MYRSVPFFRDYLRILGACVSYVEAARRLNISEDWVYKCLSASKLASKTPDVPSVFLFESEEGDGEPRWFHQHVKSTVTNSIEAIEAAARSRALHGTYTVAKFQGRTVYQIDPDLEELGFEGPEAYRRDENGKPLPELVWQAPSTDLVLGVLAAHARKLYGKNIKMDIDNRVSGGVVFAGNLRQSVAAPLPVAQIVQEAVADPERPATDEEPPADFSEIDEPDATVTDTPPASVDEEPGPAPVPAPAPVRFSTPTPPELAPAGNPLITPRRALSPLEMDLLGRANGTVEQRSAPVIPNRLDRR